MEERCVNILDGQHRLEGLKLAHDSGLIDKSYIFDVPVSIYIDLDMDDQAQIFSTINKTHRKVNKSLVYDLYEYANSDSPQKTVHDIVRILNRREESPLYRKVKLLGKAYDKSVETIASGNLSRKYSQLYHKNTYGG